MIEINVVFYPPVSTVAPRDHFVKINGYPISMNIYRHKFVECAKILKGSFNQIEWKMDVD